jgi:MFS family permease
MNFLEDLKANPKKYTSIIGGVLMTFCLGSISTLSSMAVYYMSYLREYDSLNSVRYSETIWLITLLTIFVSISALASDLVKKKFKFLTSKQFAILGSLLMSGGYLLCYFTLNHSFPLFALTYSMLFALGYGLCYIFPISVAMKWFPNSKAKATSIVLLGQGAGSCFFNQFGSLYINPENASPDDA